MFLRFSKYVKTMTYTTTVDTVCVNKRYQILLFEYFCRLIFVDERSQSPVWMSKCSQYKLLMDGMT